MSPSDKPSNKTMSWLTGTLRDALSSGQSRGGLLGLDGVSGATIADHLGDFRSELAASHTEVFLLDPRSPQSEVRSLRGVLTQYLNRVQARGEISDEAMRLAQSLNNGAGQNGQSGASGRLRRDTLGRLWTVLSQHTPAVLFVANCDHSSVSERRDIEHLARFVFADPIDLLQPESSYEDQARGAMVLVDSWDVLDLKDARYTLVDGSETAASDIRELLKDEDVVKLLVETSGGNVERVRELLNQLPAQAENLQDFRFRQLQPHEQTVVQLLAVADQAISVDRVQRAAKSLDSADFFARTLRNLCDSGFASRIVSAGDILIRLTDTDFGEHLRETTQSVAPLHLALAEAESANATGNPSLVFMAKHFLAAGRLDMAAEYGERASARLMSRNKIDDALDLLESLRAAGVELSQASRTTLAEIYVRSGELEPAIGMFEELSSFDDSDARAEIDLKIAQLRIRLGHFDAALEKADYASALSDKVRHGVELVRAEVDYALGRHEELLSRLQVLLEELETTEASAATRATVDLNKLRVRNTMGKAFIFRAAYEQAEEMFRANRSLAHQWGWEDEVARAQANLGVVALQRTDYAEALRRLQDALGSTGMRASLPRAYCMVNLASVYQQRNEFGDALETCLESLRSAKRAGDPVAYSVAAHNLATIYQDLGAFDRAHKVLQHLNERYEPEERTLSSRWNNLVVGYLSLDQGEYEKAISVFESLSSGEEEQLIYGPEAKLRLAQAHLALNQDLAARAVYDTFQLDEDNGDHDKLKSIWSLVGAQISVLDEDYESALATARRHGRKLAVMGGKVDPVTARLVAADALLGLHRQGEAKAELEEGVRVIEDMAVNVPEEFRTLFYRKPEHRRLISKLRELNGSIPADIDKIDEPEQAAQERIKTVTRRTQYNSFVGEDPRLHQIFHIIDRVAPSDASVLIYGESGTGKELISEAIHEQSNRSGRAFVKINCAAFVENLLLSELFGHEKGAFTGASSQKKGRFEVANGGTIFLDEIGDISPNTQVALLRVLQEGTFERVGGSETIKTDVRVVCATNRNLEEMVESGEFRLDLYYRLKGVVIESPALRDRRQDIPLLVRHFAREYAEGPTKSFDAQAMRFLSSYSWPGNVRELQNFVRSILLFVEGSQVAMAHIEDFSDFFVSGEFSEFGAEDVDADCTCADCTPRLQVVEAPAPTSRATVKLRAITGEITAAQAQDSLVTHIVREGLSLSELKKELETQAIRRALIESNGNVTKAAEMLRMKRPRLSQIVNGSEELSTLKSSLTG